MKQPNTHSNSPKFECSKDGFFEYLKTCKNYHNARGTEYFNPWQEVAEKIMDVGHYYKRGEIYACTEDLPLVQQHNNSDIDEKYKFALDIAPNPFEGNVFNAKIIVLTLNPLLRVKTNRDLYMALNDDDKATATIYSIKNLDLESQGMYFGNKSLEKTRTYWKERTKELQGIRGFDASDLAIIQYFGYPSVECKITKHVKQLKSIEFTQHLIEFLAKYRTDDFCFVIARRKKIWEEVLRKCYDTPQEYEKHVVELKNYRKTYISRGNVKNTTDWEKFERIIQQADKPRQERKQQEIKKLKEAIAKDDGRMVSTYEMLLKDLEA